MSSASTESGYFWFRRIHSITGAILAFVFVFCYLVPYSAALGGSDSFDFLMGMAASFPLFGWLFILIVAVPLVIHLLMSLIMLYGSSANVVSYSFYGNWVYVLQRFAGILIIPFVAYHLYETRFIFLLTGRYADFSYMHNLLSPLWVKIFYAVGISCIAFYIGNGAAVALMKWGVTVSKRSREVAAIVMWGVTFALAAWGIRLIFAF